METASLQMSAAARSAADTSQTELDTTLKALKDRAQEFARLSPGARAGLLRACLPRVAVVAERWVSAAVSAKALDPNGPSSGEEWLAGPVTTARNIRLLLRSLEDLQTGSKPKFNGEIKTSFDGRAIVPVFPTDTMDAVLQGGFSAYVRMLPEVEGAAGVVARQASFYDKKNPEGRLALILGAGNVASIPPMDALYKMFVEGAVCLVKLNPVNEYLQPFYEEALAPLVERGYLRFVKGGGEVGSYLCKHPLVDELHITGSDRTHDLIVWGPPGEEQERRKRENDPVNKRPISSELGSVTPIVFAPAKFTEEELEFAAQNVATMMVNNASCNCNAGKMLVTSRKWPQREQFLRRIREILAGVSPRKAYYPGAFDRYEHLVKGRGDAVVRVGAAREGELPWTLIFGLDGNDSAERLYKVEPFCPILSEACFDEEDPTAFLATATKFCNDTLWGTLSAVLFVHPSLEKIPAFAQQLDRTIADLRYGAIGINQWTGLVYGFVSTPWGAHPSATLANIQGGLGWVHNTYMLEGIEKVVLRGPLVVKPKPPWFATHRNTHNVGRKLVAMECEPSWFKVPGVALAAMQG